ncbi:Opticin [Podospora conica]|nr:Opticin [Schizothecium conicum]
MHRCRPPSPPQILTWLLLALALPALAVAFGTVNGVLGQHNEHEMVTRLAFQCPKGQKSDGMCFEPRSLAQLAGYHSNFMGFPIPGAGSNGAVGAPDMLDPIPEGPEAHCDDADFIDIPGYPRTREQANAALQTCIDHLRGRFHQAWAAAARLLDDKGRVQRDMTDIKPGSFGGDCTFAFASLQTNEGGRAKCNVIEGLGRALHGVQDFYAHSNWVDRSDPSQPISHVNPPGLARTDRAPFLTDLAATGPINPAQIPYNLSTGCFVLPDKTPGVGGCTDRVTHHTLTKDHGIIYLNGSFGTAGPDTPRSESVPGNFELAVQAAVEDSRAVWANLRTKLRQEFGEARGDLMICALVSDNPLRNCRFRFLSVLIDRSRMTVRSRTQEAERLAAQHVVSALTSDGRDKAAVIEFDQKSEIVSPWTLPNATTLAPFLGVNKESNIGNALHFALDNMQDTHPATYTDRGAVLLLTAGSKSIRSSWNTHHHIRRAGRDGIRVHYGCFNPPLLTSAAVPASTWSECSPGRGVVAAVLKTGGVFAFVSSQVASATENFANLVMSRGLTPADDANDAETVTLSPGLTVAGLLSPHHDVRYFSYSATAGEALNFTIRDLVAEGQGSGGCFTVNLMDRLLRTQLGTFTSCNGASPPNLVHQAMDTEEVMLVAEYNSGGQDEGTQLKVGEGEIVFAIEVNTNMPEKRVTPSARAPEVPEETGGPGVDERGVGEGGGVREVVPPQQMFDAFLEMLPQLARWINIDQVPLNQQLEQFLGLGERRIEL